MKRVTTIVALLFAVTIVAECKAQRPNRGGQRQRTQGQQGQRQRPQGQQRAQGQRPQGQRQGAANPAEMVARMLKEYDKNGDKKPADDKGADKKPPK